MSYVWLDHDGNLCDPPEADSLTRLPDSWEVCYTGGEVHVPGPQADHKATEEELAQCLTDGPLCPTVVEAMEKVDDRLTVQARHDSMLKTVHAVIRQGERGHSGVAQAIDQLHDKFIAAVKSRSDGTEEGEFTRFIDGSVVKHLKTPTQRTTATDATAKAAAAP